jgi:histone H3/H4
MSALVNAPHYGHGPTGRQHTLKQQHLDADRLKRERIAREEERERIEQAAQSSLAELSEEHREEITEAVSDTKTLMDRANLDIV